MTNDESKTALATKLKQLLITCGRTDVVLQSNKDITIQRHLEALKVLSSDVEISRRAVEAVKIANGEEDDEIDQWNTQIETELAKADDDVKCLQKWQDDYQQGKESMAREEKMKFEIKLHQTKLKLESDREAQMAGKQSIESGKEVRAKLPKLVISKFDGTYMDWTRFWGQFGESIEKSGLPSVAKFSYLKELLSNKARRDIEPLPFTPVGYNRAKAILKEKYGKESEIVKAYSKEILDLPHVSSSSPKKISEFSEKLTYCVQSLQTLKKLDDVKGLTALTLDKLPAIRGDLVKSMGVVGS